MDILSTGDNLFGSFREFNAGVDRACREIGKLVKRTATKYAPKSPTAQVKNRIRKTRRKTRKKATATSGRTPGGLERSVTFDAQGNHVDIFVPSNSEAGQYAAIIHDGKGTAWRRRGPGTVAKGAQADAKFIARAITDNEAAIERIIDHETGKALE